MQGATVEHGTIRARRIVVTLLAALVGSAILVSAATGAADPGDLDDSYSGDGRVLTDLGGVDAGKAVAVQPDGKIVVVGQTEGPTALIQGTALARYNTDGSLDTSFGAGDGFVVTDSPTTDILASDVAVQPDGKIVVGGSSNERSGSTGSDFMAIRYQPDGELDDSFAGDGIATVDFGTPNDLASGVAIDPDGKVVLGGNVGGAGSDLAVARLDQNGQPDTSFSGDGMETADAGGQESGNDVAIQDDGGIVVVGETILQLEDDFVIARFLSEGGPDDSFSSEGVQTTNFKDADAASGVAIQADGKLVVAGVADALGNGDFALARYDEAGILDETFGDQGSVTTDFEGADEARDLALDLRGNIVVVGTTASSNVLELPSEFALARYDDEGSLDPSFSDDGKLTTDFDSPDDEAEGVAIQGDGRIVAAGSSLQPSTGTDFAVARYFGEAGSCGGVDATIAGTAGADEVTGTLGDDVIDAGVGGDTITGLGGDDVICGGKGSDEIKGTNGDDELRGQRGADGLRGGRGRDKARGSKGRDTIRGARGRDKLRGGAGGDFIRGGKARDKLRGGSGFDNCKGGPGKDRIRGC
jgi:uncharacterized delta-60 repeat protein